MSDQPFDPSELPQDDSSGNPFAQLSEFDPRNPLHSIDPDTGVIGPVQGDALGGKLAYDNSNYYQPNPDSDPPDEWDRSQTADLEPEANPQTNPLDGLVPFTTETPPENSQY